MNIVIGSAIEYMPSWITLSKNYKKAFDKVFGRYKINQLLQNARMDRTSLHGFYLKHLRQHEYENTIGISLSRSIPLTRFNAESSVLFERPRPWDTSECP